MTRVTRWNRRKRYVGKSVVTVRLPHSCLRIEETNGIKPLSLGLYLLMKPLTGYGAIPFRLQGSSTHSRRFKRPLPHHRLVFFDSDLPVYHQLIQVSARPLLPLPVRSVPYVPKPPFSLVPREPPWPSCLTPPSPTPLDCVTVIPSRPDPQEGPVRLQSPGSGTGSLVRPLTDGTTWAFLPTWLCLIGPLFFGYPFFTKRRHTFRSLSHFYKFPITSVKR